MADGNIAILMMVTPMSGSAKGSPLAGESRTVVDAKNDTLVTNQTYGDFKFGSYSEVDSLEFGLSLSDTSSSSNTTVRNEDGTSEVQYKFEKFIQGIDIKPAGGTSIYPPLFDVVTVTRNMDRMSPILLQRCFKTQPLYSVSFLKRLATGTGNNVNYISFLRIDFDNALITDISWGTGQNTMTETLKFVYRKINMQYRPQDNKGTPGSVVPFETLSLLPT